MTEQDAGRRRHPTPDNADRPFMPATKGRFYTMVGLTAVSAAWTAWAYAPVIDPPSSPLLDQEHTLIQETKDLRVQFEAHGSVVSRSLFSETLDQSDPTVQEYIRVKEDLNQVENQIGVEEGPLGPYRGMGQIAGPILGLFGLAGLKSTSKAFRRNP